MTGWKDLNERSSGRPTQVARTQRSLDRAYVALSLLFVFALTAVVFVAVIQASPSVTLYGLGWFLSDGQAGVAYLQHGSDSPLRTSGGPDQIGFERQLFTLVNKARVDRGLTPLKQSDALTRAARSHSSDMAASRQLESVDSTGRTPIQRAEASGFNPPQFVVEALAAGYGDPEQLMRAMLANSNMAANLLNGDADEIGVGYAFARDDKTYRHYWTVDLGKRSGLVFNVVVNNGAEATASSQVMLHIGGKGWAQQMLISNSPDYAGAAWEPYAETRTWTLSEGTGPKQIYVKLIGPGNQQVESIGAIALNAAAKGVKPGAPRNDALAAPRPPIVRSPAGEIATSGQVAPSDAPSFAVPAGTAISPGYYQTSEYMFGKVVVGIVLPQCNGAVDKCTETWTPAMMDQVVSQIQAGTNWWVNKMSRQVSFVYDQQRQVPTGYEPIKHPQTDESLWLGDVMTHMGFAGSTYFEQVYAYNNWMRQKYNTDWAYTIFIANSQHSANGTFSNGYFAYSYVPGPFTVATYDNDGYTINNMSSVIADETGHIFGALDQYSGANVACTATSGYLVFQNQNSQQNCTSNQDSIMRGGVTPFVNNLIDPFAWGMVGWRASKSGTLPDPINTTPILAVNQPASPTSNGKPTISGTAQDQPFPSPTGNSVTINTIAAVKFRVDGGAWQNAKPSDGSSTFNKVSQGFVFAPSLAPGSHLIEVQAVNRVNNTSAVVSTTVVVQDAALSAGSAQAQPTDPAATVAAPTPTVSRPTIIPPAKPTVVPLLTPAPPPTTGTFVSGTLTIQINAGNTAISVPAGEYTASTLLAAINAQGGSVIELDGWTGSVWQAFVAGPSAKDFSIREGIGFVVKAKAESTWKVPLSNATRSKPFKLDKGWNMMGAPLCRDGMASCYSAATLAAAIDAQGGDVAEVDSWVDGSWSAYQPGYPFNDFPITVGASYFVQTNKASVWNP